MVKLSNNYKGLIVVASLLLGLGCKPKQKSSINAFAVKHSDGWNKTKQMSIDTTNSVKMRLQFLNNPYQFADKNNMAIYVNNKLVYKGQFQNFIEVFLPNSFFGDRVLPGMVIYDGDTAYNFIHKQSMFLSNGDKHLCIVFCPDNELDLSCYMFSLKEPIL